MIQILAQAPPGQAPPPSHAPRSSAGTRGGFAAALAAAGAEPRDGADHVTGDGDTQAASSSPDRADQADQGQTADAGTSTRPADWPARTAEASGIDATIASLMLALGAAPVVTPDSTSIGNPAGAAAGAAGGMGGDSVPVPGMPPGSGADVAATIVRAAMRITGEGGTDAAQAAPGTGAQAAVPAATQTGDRGDVGAMGLVASMAASQAGSAPAATGTDRVQRPAAAETATPVAGPDRTVVVPDTSGTVPVQVNADLSASGTATLSASGTATLSASGTATLSASGTATPNDGTQSADERTPRLTKVEHTVREGAHGTAASTALDQAPPPVQAQATAPVRVEATGVTQTTTVDATDRAQLTSRLVDTVHSAVLRGDHEVHIRLDPPDLGRIDVRIADTTDGLRVTFHAATREAHDLLSEQLSSLRTGLEARDLRLDRVDVHHSSVSAGSDRQFGGWLGRQQDGQRGQQGGEDQQPAWSPLAGMHDRTRGTGADARPARPVIHRGSGRVDMLA